MDHKRQFNPIQEAYLTLIGETRVNKFNGPQIVEDLRANPELWERVIPLFTAGENVEFKVRELLEGYPYIDTLYILPVTLEDGSIAPEINRALSSLVNRWGADEIKQPKIQPKNSQERRYFSLWFD